MGCHYWFRETATWRMTLSKLQVSNLRSRIRRQPVVTFKETCRNCQPDSNGKKILLGSCANLLGNLVAGHEGSGFVVASFL